MHRMLMHAFGKRFCKSWIWLRKDFSFRYFPFSKTFNSKYCSSFCVTHTDQADDTSSIFFCAAGLRRNWKNGLNIYWIWSIVNTLNWHRKIHRPLQTLRKQAATNTRPLTKRKAFCKTKWTWIWPSHKENLRSIHIFAKPKLTRVGTKIYYLFLFFFFHSNKINFSIIENIRHWQR